MGDEADFVIVSCQECGPVPVPVHRFEVHADHLKQIALYAFPCPRCGEIGTGGCNEMVAHLLAAGVRRRELRSVEAAPITEAEVRAFSRWLADDPAWPSASDTPGAG